MAEKRDWKKIVSESNGTRIIIPDKFTIQAKEIFTKQKALQEKLNGVAKEEILINISTLNLLTSIREYLEENGRKDIWVKDIGFDQNAIAEGEMVLNIVSPQQRQ